MSFTLGLMASGYVFNMEVLHKLESNLLLVENLWVLEDCIIDLYSVNCLRSLQELCRASLKRAHLHSKIGYREFVTNLNYPARLKSYLLGEEGAKHQGVSKSYITVSYKREVLTSDLKYEPSENLMFSLLA